MQNINTNFPVGDFLIKVKNAAMAKNKEVVVKPTKHIISMAEAIKKLGYIDEIKKEKELLKISLTFKNRKPLLSNLKLVSKPGLRVYQKADDIAEKRGPSTYLISTPKGIISSKEAIKNRVGGEIVAEIW